MFLAAIIVFMMWGIREIQQPIVPPQPEIANPQPIRNPEPIRRSTRNRRPVNRLMLSVTVYVKIGF